MTPLNSWIKMSIVGCLLCTIPHRAAETIVHYRAVIEESPFTTHGYTVGSEIHGYYLQDENTVPLEVGGNFTDYTMPGMSLFFGDAHYESPYGRLNLVHYLSWPIDHPIDVYRLVSFALSGPNVEGFKAAAVVMDLVDTDNSVYGDMTPPYPISLPTPSLFEEKSLEVTFLAETELVERRIRARIISIEVDSDQDGVPDGVDEFPNSRDVGGNIWIGDCDTGVATVVFHNGATISDLIYEISDRAKNHGKFVSGVAQLKNALRNANVINDKAARAIQQCAATAALP